MPGKTLILGFGISGAMASALLPDAVVVSKPVSMAFPSGPTYLYETPMTRRFVAELGFNPATLTIRPGYVFGGAISEPEESVLYAYYKKTRGGEPDEEWMSDHMQKSFDVLDVSFSDVIKRVFYEREEQVLFDNIKSIDLNEKTVSGEICDYEYDNLIVTLPYPTFCKMAGIPCDVSYKPISYCVEPATKLGSAIYETDFDYLYSLGEEPYRITKFKEPWVMSEYLGEKPDAMHTFFCGKILGGQATDMREYGVHFLGRYAQWKKNVKAHQVLETVARLGQVIQ